MKHTINAMLAMLASGLALVGCGDPPLSPRIQAKPQAPPTTECQDHTLSCAGPPITVPPVIVDPAKKDEKVVDSTLDIGTAIHLSRLPRTE